MLSLQDQLRDVSARLFDATPLASSGSSSTSSSSLSMPAHYGSVGATPFRRIASAGESTGGRRLRILSSSQRSQSGLFRPDDQPPAPVKKRKRRQVIENDDYDDNQLGISGEASVTTTTSTVTVGGNVVEVLPSSSSSSSTTSTTPLSSMSPSSSLSAANSVSSDNVLAARQAVRVHRSMTNSGRQLLRQLFVDFIQQASNNKLQPVRRCLTPFLNEMEANRAMYHLATAELTYMSKKLKQCSDIDEVVDMAKLLLDDVSSQEDVGDGDKGDAGNDSNDDLQ